MFEIVNRSTRMRQKKVTKETTMIIDSDINKYKILRLTVRIRMI